MIYEISGERPSHRPNCPNVENVANNVFFMSPLTL